MSVFLRMFKHLLPRARAWNITISKELREFFTGLANGVAVPLRTFIDAVWGDLFPDTTREISAWEWQFGLQKTGLTEQERRDRLDAVWQALSGGQDLAYIEDTVQSNGFTVYFHEWWVPGSSPAVARNPTTAPLITMLEMLVNKLYTITRLDTALCGEPGMECGEVLAECGQYTGFDIDRVTYAVPTNPDHWPYIIYIGGVTFGTVANVPSARREEFENLCLKLCPEQDWLGMLIAYGITQLLTDGDMEDASPLVDFTEGATGQLMPDGDMEA